MSATIIPLPCARLAFASKRQQPAQRQEIDNLRATMRAQTDQYAQVSGYVITRLKELGAPPQAFLFYEEF